MKIFHIGQKEPFIEKGWINNETPEIGETYIKAVGGKFIDGVLVNYSGHTPVYSIVLEGELKEVSERAWRDSELSRTDRLVILPDYPRDGTDLIAYRQALADYPAQSDFPNGARPTI